MYDGYLARLDTLTMTIDKSVAVGANPDQIALHYDKIYVPVSEGMNYPITAALRASSTHRQ